MKKLLPLILFSILILGGFVNANAYDTWMGNVSFNVKVTGIYEDSGEEKFENITDSLNGKLCFFVDEEPVKNEKGNYIEFRDEVGTVIIGIKELGAIATDYAKLGKSDKFLLVGTGVFTDPEDHDLQGIAYIDSKGTLAESKITGDTTSISVSGKIGGVLNSLDKNYTFSASFKSVLVLSP